MWQSLGMGKVCESRVGMGMSITYLLKITLNLLNNAARSLYNKYGDIHLLYRMAGLLCCKQWKRDILTWLDN